MSGTFQLVLAKGSEDGCTTAQNYQPACLSTWMNIKREACSPNFFMIFVATNFSTPTRLATPSNHHSQSNSSECSLLVSHILDRQRSSEHSCRLGTIPRHLSRADAALWCRLEYQHGIIRSPYYMEGRHRAKPRQKTGSKKKTDISEEAPYHNAILYDLNGYTLDDLEALANQLRAILGPEKVALALSAQENKATSWR